MALPISDDLRARIIRFYEAHDDYTQEEIADEFGVSLSCLEKLLHRWWTTGSSAARPHAGGKKRLLQAHEQTLRTLVATQPDVTLAELKDQVAAQTAVVASPPTLCRALQRLRLGRKKSPNSPVSNKPPQSS
jgi:transposase